MGSLGIVPGLGAASDESVDNRDDLGEVSGTITLDSANAMSDQELESYTQKQYLESDPDVAAKVVPPQESTISALSTSPSDPTNVTLEDTWDSNVRTIKGNTYDEIIGETRHMVSVYKGDYKSSSGDNVYILWHMSRADFGPEITSWNTKVEKMENFINLPSDWSLFTYQPQDSISGGGQDINVGIGAGYGAGSMSLGTTVTVGGGTVRTTNQTATGSGSKYQLEFTGCSKGDNGTEIMNGLSLLTTSDSSISSGKLSWHWRTLLNTTLDCFY
ncbi:hypothetical protein [Haladaptatus sp. DYF46]|uniref:hypothetical protein n=1 Tax=Haladaptatus sp. DYF46 TaxID=2886041 RepID=UPI001E482261|nr:hypothetical protein [Haladaptatus sp. DYF46]